MFWLFRAARRLKQLGIMGMNRRNATMILDHNPRAKFPLVDDKLRMRDLCVKIGVPTPAVYAAVSCYAQLRQLDKILDKHDDFVIKPNNGSGGRGILVVIGRQGPDFLRHDGERLGLDKLRQHLSDILSGMYSLGGRPDEVIVQQRIRLHPAFEAISYKGIPDIRVILYRNEPAMAMLRLPTKASSGKANLHQGGIGAGVELATGITNHAVIRNRFCERHPDTHLPVVGMQVPFWPEVLTMSRSVAEAVGLGYIGVDIIVDIEHGPMLLEANARPGLAIQMANGKGLVPRLAEIDRMFERARVVDGGRWQVDDRCRSKRLESPEAPAVAGRIGPEETPIERRLSA
jgi:alpha-L-glutamate ligase-like protein